MASEPPPELDRIDPLGERREGALAWGVSELAYTQMHSVAVDHALLPRTAALPAPRRWTCAGPRNIGGRILALAQDPTNALRLWAGSAHGGLWRTTDGGDTWDHVSGRTFNDPVGALAIHPARPNSIWVGTGSHRADSVSGTGLYRVTVAADGTVGIPRQLVSAPPPFDPPASMTEREATRGAALRYTAIELDPENPDCAFIAGQTGLWHCVDSAGAPAWRRLLPAESEALALFDGDPDGLPPLASAPLSDLNAFWPSYVTDLRVARDPRDRATFTDDGGREVARYLVVFAAVSSIGGGVGGIYRGRFDRETRRIDWDSQKANIPFPQGLPGRYLRARLALCRSQPNHVFAVFQGVRPNASPSGPVYRSSDCGDNWTAGGIFAGDNNQAFYSMVLEVHPDDPTILVGGTLDLSVSTDGGATFTQILDWQFYDRGDHSQHADQHALIFDIADRRKIWSGNDGGLSMARDISGRLARPGFWRKRSHGIIAGQFQDLSVFPHDPADATDPLRFLTAGGLQDNGSWISYGGPTWYHIGWADGSGSAIHGADPRAVFSAQNGGCNYPTIAGGLTPGLGSVIASPVIADIASVQPRMEVAHSWFPVPGGGPFVGFIDQDPRPVPEPVPPVAPPLRARRVIYSGTASAVGRPVARLLTVPAATPPVPGFQMAAASVTAIGPPPAAVAAGESASAVAFGPPPAAAGGPVDGWIGTDKGQLFHTIDAPLGTAAAPWGAVASFPPAPLRAHQPDRILAHPIDPRVVAIAASPAPHRVVVSVVSAGAIGAAGTTISFSVGLGAVQGPIPATAVTKLGASGLEIRFLTAAATAGDVWVIDPNGVTKNGVRAVDLAVAARHPVSAVAPVVVTVAAAGPVGAAATTIRFKVGTADISGPILVVPFTELGDSGLVIRFTVAALAAGDSWTIGTDNRVTKNGNPSNEVEVIARLYGRVLLSYDRGVTWFDSSWARARPAPPARADSDSLPFSPVTSLRWDTGAGGAGPLRLFVGTLAGVYVLENLPAPPPAAPPAPPPPGPLAGFNPVWRPFPGLDPGLLPLTLVNDIEMIAGSRILRIATFGRGVWDCDLDGGQRYQLFIRQTVVESGRIYPRALPAILPDDPRLPARQLFMDHAHAFDIRVDTAPFEFLDDVVDGVEFDERLGVDDIRPLERQAVYVQVHNSGWDTVSNVAVHLLWARGPAAPLARGPAAPAPVPAGLPDAATFYVSPNFNPANAWQRVGPPRPIAQVRPGEPKVVRFDWVPPETIDLPDTHVALLALCTASPDDRLPDALPGGVVTMADFLRTERRAALRIVPVRVSPAVDLFIRDGVDDNARAGNVAFIGRSPDIIVVQQPPDDPAAAFAQLIDARPGDFIKGGVPNHIYVRIHNRGLSTAIAEVRLWATPLDTNQQPNFRFASWVSLTDGEVAPVSANSTELVPVIWNNPPDPNPADAGKAYGLIVTLGGIGVADPLAEVPALTSAAEFWAYFGERFGSDNAALRVLRYVP